MGIVERLTGRALAMIVGVIVLIVAVGLFVRSCDSRRSAALQTKVERSQNEAFTNSAAEAVNTVSTVGHNEATSEATTRSNERTIRDAEGASDAVNPAVRDAGFASLCRRKSFRDSPTGRVRCAPAR